MESGGGAGTEDGGVGTFPVPKAVVIIARVGGEVGVGGFGSWDGAVVSSDGAAVDAAGAGSGRAATGVTADGLVRLGVDDGDAAGRGAVDVAAERCGATFDTALAGLGGAFLAAARRFDLGFCALVFVARRTVVFAAGFLAVVVRLTNCFAAAALPVFLVDLPTCLIGRFATVALRVFLLAFANRLIGRLAVVLRTSFVLTAALTAADFRFAVFTGRLAFVARPDDFDALLFFEAAAGIEPSPIAREDRLPF